MSGNKPGTTLVTLFPEIFPIIASHLPFYVQSSTLLALGLTDRRLNKIIIPRLLYQKVFLKGEERTLRVLKAFKTEVHGIDKEKISQLDANIIPITYHIRRLSISSELSKEAQKSGVDALTELFNLIDICGLPNLVSLAIHMDDGLGWNMEDNYKIITNSGRPGRSFWASLKEKCPKVKEISLTGVVDYEENRWFEESNVYEYQGLERFRLEYIREYPGEAESTAASGLERLFDTLSASFSLLHTLDLSIEDANYVDATVRSGLFTRCFPRLRVLILGKFMARTAEVASEFWTFHPLLERIELASIPGNWFNGLSPGVLARLKILKAPFPDVRTLLPLLKDQLINLTISSSINGQVPYLLRSVLPNGLASLRSLGIYQGASNHSRKVNWEGSRWLEDEHGNISESSKRKAARPFDANYIMSLARGAPNLEELELIGESKPPIEPIALALANFSNLKRLYILATDNGGIDSFVSPECRIPLLIVARVFAEECRTLESVTAVPRDSWGMHSAIKIQRDVNGEISLEEELGSGRIMGLEDENDQVFI
ncbi:hypothetical protein BDZ94DRAFT_1303296 [Collybia nuda]|uniref:Uncharacterized protein n=1 Tax=Collybia nuda TaxID=64659 RepID=A0A9P6CRH0_9AGAR|nr:hypothetical protein BDZ94DRAFT_1303296 [Collybia nuda]